LSRGTRGLLCIGGGAGDTDTSAEILEWRDWRLPDFAGAFSSRLNTSTEGF
jgi:hypothetical protein